MFLMFFLAAPQGAKASETIYCYGKWLKGYETCYGSQRWFNALYGIGEEHAVCIGQTQGGNQTCTHGPGEGTYDALGELIDGWPWIENRAAGENQVYGTTFAP